MIVRTHSMTWWTSNPSHVRAEVQEWLNAHPMTGVQSRVRSIGPIRLGRGRIAKARVVDGVTYVGFRVSYITTVR